MNRVLTGKPSVDRPWMKFYPEEIQKLQVPKCTLVDYLKNACPGMDVVAMHYYGNDITWKTIYEDIEKTAKALKAIGFGEGDQIPVFFRSVPEFLSMLLAAEKIGASLLCRDNTLEENIEAVQIAGAKVIFAHDFLSQEEKEAYIKEAGIEKVIILSPYRSAVKSEMPEHIHAYIKSNYTEKSAEGAEVWQWDEFIAGGEAYEGDIEAPADIERPLFRSYTSGSTGTSKQVIHSAYSMIGILHQMSLYGGEGDHRLTWMLTSLPPCLVAVVVSMILTPLASNKLLILNPFCDVQDLDLEVMRYRPNFWPIIPMFMEIIMRSTRIPEDYDMSHILAAGAGCESFNNGQLRRAQEYLEKHNCHITFTTGYGQSEAGSNCTFPCSAVPMGNGNIGIPMPITTMSIFKPGTQEELTYNQIGEICKTGPGNMIGYDSKEATARALQKHEDGMVWLHTGDIGYMTEDGIIFALTRGHSERFSGGELIGLVMENKIIDAQIDGIVDEFFVIAPDQEHEGYFLPYLYVVLEDGYTIDDIRSDVMDIMEEHERPVDIIQLPERPFFHFKTNRIGLTKALQKQCIN